MLIRKDLRLYDRELIESQYIRFEERIVYTWLDSEYTTYYTSKDASDAVPIILLEKRKILLDFIVFQGEPRSIRVRCGEYVGLSKVIHNTTAVMHINQYSWDRRNSFIAPLPGLEDPAYFDPIEKIISEIESGQRILKNADL